MNAPQIQQALWRDLVVSHKIMMPNFTPSKWFECDMFAITKAGYWTEHEIKLSVADYKADAKKYQRRHYDGYEDTYKHAQLTVASERCPSRFWFVMPEDVASKIEVPEWAGLKVCAVSDSGRVYVNEEKPAPRLHKIKATTELQNQVMLAAYYRFWNQRQNMTKEVERQLKRINQTTP